DFNAIATLGAFGFGFAQILLLVVVVQSIRGGRKATDQVWDGAHGLEWTLSSPPPYHSFSPQPVVK
ncbi:MAG: cytochrome c oxidase subunit I, partial [Gammaproteobacteria bacterium]|nr:cytochrome c oxidase subunit I [Gammaproteobacteria bacterium]